MYTYDNHTDVVNQIEFLEDHILISGGDDGLVNFTDVDLMGKEDEELLLTIPNGEDGVRSFKMLTRNNICKNTVK
jgi:hypothetical protein